MASPDAALPCDDEGARPGASASARGLEWVSLSALVLGSLLLAYLAMFHVSWPRIALSPQGEAGRWLALALAAATIVLGVCGGRRSGEPAVNLLLLAHVACGAGAFMGLQLKGMTALRGLLAWEFVTCLALLARSYSLKRRGWKSLLLVAWTGVIVLHLVLLVGEVWLRMLMASPNPARWPCISYGNTSWKMVELYDREKNSFDLRERDLEEFKPPRTYRVFFAGDSVTFGLGIPFEETFVKRVEKRIDAQARALGMRFETINAGWPGHNTRHEFETIRQKGLYYEPDLVILVYFPNDVEAMASSMPYQGICAALDPLYENSISWAWGSRQVHSLLERLGVRETYADWLREQYHSAGFRQVQQHIFNCQVWCRRYGKRFGVVIFPFMENLRAYEFGYAHQMIRETAATHSIPCLDLLSVFAGQDDASMQLSPAFDHHPGVAANALAAPAIEAFIVSLMNEQGKKAPPPSAR